MAKYLTDVEIEAIIDSPWERGRVDEEGDSVTGGNMKGGQGGGQGGRR